MATIDELVVQLSADTKDLQAEMRSAVATMEKSTAEMAKSVETLSKKGAKDTSFLQNAMATMVGYISGEAVLGAIQSVGHAIAGFLEEGVQGASDAQAAVNGFAQSLFATGKYSEDAVKSFSDFADALQNTTGIEAEATLSAGKLLASLTTLSGDGLVNATKASADLSAAMGIDLDSAAKLVAKGVNGSTEAFKKMGIVIEEGSTKAETASNVFAALNSRFGGAAASQANTYAGAIKILSKSWGEVSEELGNAIVQNPVVAATINQISKFMLQLSDYLKENKKEFMELIANGIIGAIDAFGTLIGVINDVWKVFKVLGQTIAEPFQALATGIAAANAAASGDFTQAKQIIVNGMQEMGQAEKDAFGDSPLLTKFQDKVAELSNTAKTSFGEIGASIDQVGPKLDAAAQGAKQIDLTPQQEQIKSWAKDLSDSATTTEAFFKNDLDLLTAQHDAKLISDTEFFAAKEALVQQNIVNESAMLDQAANQGLIKGQALAQARYALETKQQVDITKFQAEQNKQREANLGASLNTIATLSSSGNKTLAGIGKAAAIYQATIDGYAAVQKALASAPPPLNFVLAAGVGAATVANVAKISGTALASGIDEVPGIGGRDQFPAILAPGERVVPSKTNEDLTAFLREQGNQPRTILNVTVNMHDIFSSDPREMGMKIVETINEAAQANGVTLLGATIR